jgi:ubiquitin carboxyl-terminal hydrolase 1
MMNHPGPDHAGDYDFDDEDAYLRHYIPTQAWEQKPVQFVVISLLVAIFTVTYYLAFHVPYLRYYRINSPTDLLWDAVVFLTPASILVMLDKWLNPPLFPRPMLQTPTRSHGAKSELLARILGLDKSSGIMLGAMQSGKGVFSAASAARLGAQLDKSRPPGLGNWDNSCYQNSILQGLASLKFLPAYLSVSLQDGETTDVNAETVSTLRALIADLNDIENNGKTLWTPSKLKSMSTWQQQDAQEYFSRLLNDVDQEMAKVFKAMDRMPGLETDGSADETAASQHSDDSGYHSLSAASKYGSELKVLRNPLEGLVAQRVACIKCGHSDGLSMIPFNCLTLSLDIDKLEYDLFERLDAYTKVEFIEGVECGKCTLLRMKRLLPILIERSRNAAVPEESIRDAVAKLEAVEMALEEDEFDEKTITQNCRISVQNKVSSTKTKQTVIARAPQSLAIHINRSVFDPATGRMFKNLSAVRFPQSLDLGPWCLGSAKVPTELSGPLTSNLRGGDDNVSSEDEERWILDPTTPMNAGDQRPSKLSGPIYELRAIVTHVGRHENGHYICYRNIARSLSPRSSEIAETKDSDSNQSSVEVGSDNILAPKSPKSCNEDEMEMEWWKLSDENVYRVDEETVFAQGGAFMLFYECVDAQQVMDSVGEDTPSDDPDDIETPVASNTAPHILEHKSLNTSPDRDPASTKGNSSALDLKQQSSNHFAATTPTADTAASEYTTSKDNFGQDLGPKLNPRRAEDAAQNTLSVSSGLLSGWEEAADLETAPGSENLPDTVVQPPISGSEEGSQTGSVFEAQKGVIIRSMTMESNVEAAQASSDIYNLAQLTPLPPDDDDVILSDDSH